MFRDIITSIKMQYNSLTRVERNIANYVIGHATEVMNMPIVHLAEICSVGESSIFRFCQHLGCIGYQDFKMQLALSINASHLSQKDQPPNHQESSLPLQIRTLYSRNLTILERTYQTLNPEHLQIAAQKMSKAGRILLIGTGRSLVSIFYAYHRIIPIIPTTCFSLDIKTQSYLASTLSPDDVVIGFSSSGATPEILHIAQNIKRRGPYLIGITNRDGSPFTDICDQSFICSHQPVTNYGENHMMLTAHAFLLDALCTVYVNVNNGL